MGGDHHSEGTPDNDNAPIAFVLVICAGLSTCIGAAFVFNTRLVKLASKRFLAGALGISAGVILYLSLVEIFVKSHGAFEEHGFSDSDSYAYATLSLFGGILFYKGIDFVVHLLGGDFGDVNIDLYDLDGSSSVNPRRGVVNSESSAADKTSALKDSGHGQQPHNVVVELNNGSVIRPSPDLHTMQLSLAGKTQQPHQHELAAESKADMGEVEAGARNDGAVKARTRAGEAAAGGDDERLVRMGLMTAVAIGIHNFPEGLATFVSVLSDPSVGFALAVAIAIHNIPEGLCVAIPVYYATGSRWKAFGWALLSGISEPMGAALAWIVLKDHMSQLAYGLVFGFVAGMMINVTIHELIPTAVRYDPTDKVTTNSIFAGMAVMGASLMLFKS